MVYTQSRNSEVFDWDSRNLQNLEDGLTKEEAEEAARDYDGYRVWEPRNRSTVVIGCTAEEKVVRLVHKKIEVRKWRILMARNATQVEIEMRKKGRRNR